MADDRSQSQLAGIPQEWHEYRVQSRLSFIVERQYAQMSDFGPRRNERRRRDSLGTRR